jgi:predicted transposase YbfD/YdcC
LRRHALSKKTFEAAEAANAHLIVQIKSTQPTLHRQVEAVCATAEPLSSERSIDKNRRNRHETRAGAVFEAKPAVAETEWQPHVAALIRVERTVLHFNPATGRWKPSFEISFYLSNRLLAARTAAAAVRRHWGIENTSHYSRDVSLREDASRIRKNPGVFARLRSFAHNILRCNQTGTIPQDRLAAAFGALKSMLSMTFSKER